MIDREILFEKYEVEKKTTYDISVEIGCSQQYVSKLLKIYGIKTRKRWMDAKTGKHHNNHQVEVKCDTCGNSFSRSPSHLSNENFCSRKCLGIANGKRNEGKAKPSSEVLKLTCNYCQSEYQKLKSQHRSKNNFCSTKCHDNWRAIHNAGANSHLWEGGKREWYGMSWKIRRKEAIERDNGTCRRCGKTKAQMGKNPDVHHKIPFKFFGLEFHEIANGLANLVCLCNKCHQIAEHNEREYLN